MKTKRPTPIPIFALGGIYCVCMHLGSERVSHYSMPTDPEVAPGGFKETKSAVLGKCDKGKPFLIKQFVLHSCVQKGH